MDLKQIKTAWRGHETFAAKLVRERNPRVIVDLGVDYGFSTIVWGLSLKKVGSGKCYGVDRFNNNRFSIVNSYLENFVLCDFVKLIKGSFNSVVKKWNKGQIDILHIDGNHKYEHVKNDFLKWEKHLSEDAIVLFHDTQSRLGV